MIIVVTCGVAGMFLSILKKPYIGPSDPDNLTESA